MSNTTMSNRDKRDAVSTATPRATPLGGIRLSVLILLTGLALVETQPAKAAFPNLKKHVVLPEISTPIAPPLTVGGGTEDAAPLSE